MRVSSSLHFKDKFVHESDLSSHQGHSIVCRRQFTLKVCVCLRSPGQDRAARVGDKV